MDKEAKKKILIVDDEEGITDLIGGLFTRKGFITLGASGAEEGLAIFKKEKPDLVLIDIYMPGSSLSGIELLKNIKAIDKDARCLMLTYMGGEGLIEECKKLGANQYIQKPVQVDTLIKIVEEILK